MSPISVNWVKTRARSPLLNRLFEHLGQAGQLARAAGAGGGSRRPEEVCRVVAHLLEASSWWRGRVRAAPSLRSCRCGPACRRPQPGRAWPARRSACRTPSSRSFPGGRRRSVGRSSTGAAPNSAVARRRRRAASLVPPSRSIGMAKRSRKDLSEPSGARVEEPHDRPQLGQAGFSTGVPVIAIRRSAGMALHALGGAGRRCSLSAAPRRGPGVAQEDGGEELLVAAAKAVRRENKVRLLGPPGERPAVEPVGPVVDVHRQVRGEPALRLALPVARRATSGRQRGSGRSGEG